MNDTTRINIVVVDLAKTLLRESSCMLLATGDEYANRFGAIIVRNGEAVDIANFLVSGSFIRPDGVTLTLEGVSEGNTVYVDLPSDCYKYDGVFTLSIKIVKGDVTETVRMVDGYIRRTETGNYVADEETIITLDKIQGMANEMAQLYEQAKETMEELSGATENLENALEEAETLPEKLPYIGDNGNWMQWDDDAGKFIDSGSPSRGIPGVNGTTPVKGKDYFDGEPGYTPQKGIDYFDGTSVTITNVSQSTADGGANVVTFSDGKTLSIKNGSKGIQGEQGPAGPAGSDGAPGYTPVKGTDYFTAADKQDIVNDALSALAGADPSDAGYAELKRRTSTLEIKFRNAVEDIEYLQQDVDVLETTFVALCHPQINSDDPSKNTFAYTSRILDEEWNETLYDDITIISPSGDVYAGKMNYGMEEMYTRKKLATEEYVQEAMILTAPNGNKFRLTVDNNGNLGTVAVE